MPRVTASPLTRPPIRRRPRRRWLAAALLGLAALTIAACKDGTQTEQNSSSTSSSSSSTTTNDGSQVAQNAYTINDQVTQLHLDGKAGAVSVVAADGPISVTEKLRWTDSKPTTSHNVAGNTLTLTDDGCPEQRPVNGRCEVAWEIRAPAGTNLDLNSKAGGIELTGTAGTVVAKTSAGGVHAKDLTSKSVTAQSRAGGVKLRFAQPPDLIDASTNAGGVQIEVPAGTGYAVDADSDTGDPEIEVQRDNASPHKIKASTNAGSIEISNG
jgi:Putative adhesin